mmetsp:Transcript_22512/g.46040  ORF Transcript_22512/g.46040 Transcript_22512/m.46040 type:complete len:343 (+) Transcript_22512:124-1152(+)|eukprot:CAMPEP_0202854434 /NCGR_PEP_ID=MMETSP1389-20130828/91001_1 /ASSEMBLY_ACC=CAM_ASM_000865 /TAXON_ID=302021 /ORGANISM="Rhodomonas sp., Strain CCMP768" /LENGTH=342 /DNA_ID=CAMNT_0049533021 /DNA_START=19 /DNA_END=1047 /DNA_ORIENTATION=-
MGNASSALDCCNRPEQLEQRFPQRAEPVSDLIRATINRDVRALNHILTQPGVVVDAPDSRGRTALHFAAQRGCSESVDILLLHGANPHQKAKDGKTALTLAMENNHHELVEKLLKSQSMHKQQPATPGTPYNNGTTPRLGASSPYTVSNEAKASADAFHAEAAKKYFEGDNKRAEELYLKALNANPNHLRSLCNYGALLQNVHSDFNRAEDMYKKALAVDDKDAVTLYNYGLLLENARQDFKGAEGMYQRALAADPKHVDTLCNYGALLKTVHQEYGTAEHMYQAALNIDPRHVDTLCNYALLLRDCLNNQNKAQQLIQRAKEIAPHDDWLQRHAHTFGAAT